MANRIYFIGAMLLLVVCSGANAELKPNSCAKLASTAEVTWRFAVAGDSRNCGDVVMPAIANDVWGVQSPKVDFYWHLGDFRAGYGPDEDMRQQGDRWDLAKGTDADNCKAGTDCFRLYQNTLWSDFIAKQIEPFSSHNVTVFLGIGNHELYKNRPPDQQLCHYATYDDLSRRQYLETFAPWIDSSFLRKFRCGDSASSCPPRTYYYWVWKQVEFISLDNSEEDGFDPDQVAWFKDLITKVDAGITTVVVGMHRALPDSWACGHSMNGDGNAKCPSDNSFHSGMQVYQALADFKRQSNKSVYVLASHSHFMMTDIFDTPDWREYQKKNNDRDVLCGMLIGSAGAQRYKLPKVNSDRVDDKTKTYGYFVASVTKAGQIGFDFHSVDEKDLQKASRAPATLAHWCYTENVLDRCYPPPASCKNETIADPTSGAAQCEPLPN